MLERLLATIDLLAVDLEGREERFNLAVSDSVPARPVTAVIVTYQSARTIGRTLAAARRGYDDNLLDTIIVDNDSTDGTRGIIAREADWGRVILADKNNGFGRGCNIGFAH